MIEGINDKKHLYKLIAFLVMSDGGVYFSPKNKNCHFVFTQSENHLDFVEYTKQIIDHVTSSKIKYVNRENETDANRKNQYRLASKSHPLFTQMRDHIYVGSYKSLSPHYLNLLDWQSLAILYMSDGSLEASFRPEIGMKNPSYNMTLNLKRLSYGDYVLLKRALEEKEMGVWNINKSGKYYILRLRTKFNDLVNQGIKEYIIPSFQYKLIPEYRTISPK